MSFHKTQSAETVSERTRFDLDDSNDLRVVKEFENDLRPYFERFEIVFGKKLSGYDLYLHENNLFRYTKKYPEGAVFFEKLAEYRMADMKMHALALLWDRRKEAEKYEEERANQIAVANA